MNRTPHYPAGATPTAGDHACEVTKPNGAIAPGGMHSPNGYGNDALWTDLRPHGEVVFEPGGAGFILPDGGLGIKWPWAPYIPGELTVIGKRTDANAPLLRVKISEGWIDGLKFFPTYLVFSTPGCWEVTGALGGHRLTFVTRVILRNGGPDWRPTSIP